jgi:hypothetical protein
MKVYTMIQKIIPCYQKSIQRNFEYKLIQNTTDMEEINRIYTS